MATPDPALVDTSDFYIDQTDIEVDLSNSRKFSFIQQFAQRVDFGYAGGRWLNVNDIQGGFVGAEGGKKPIANPTTTKDNMVVREWAVVVPLPKRLVDANPQRAVERIRARIPEAFARDFDTLATTGAGVGGQDNLSQVTQTVSLGTKTVANGGLFADLNEGLRILVSQGRRLTGTVLDDLAEPVFNGAVDLQGRPLWVDSPVGPDTSETVRQGRLMGRPAAYVPQIAVGTGSTKTIGYMGDWSRLLWGQITPIEYLVSTEGTYVDGDGTTHSAVQENLVLVRAECLIGVGLADANAFVRILAGTTSAAS